MCGIVGIMRFDGEQVDAELLRTMTDLLTHRGPDDSGSWIQGSVGFGHRRLSIIDVASSVQPMATPDRRLHLCFNGEILNYRRIRESLTGYHFRTDGDTETLLAAHHRNGAAAVNALQGQFAYAIHDAETGELSLVRDRLGVLPLYYHVDASAITFASEIKALLPALPDGPEVDTASLDDYLSLRSVPAPYTLFAGIRKLPAGHRLRVSATGGVTTDRWWSLPDDVATEIDPAQAVDKVAAALESAVADAMVADVPVGAYLSGGVDSSLIVALMSKLRGGEGVETFAAGFGDPRFDELPWARRVSQAVGTRHHEVVVQPDDFATLWPQLTWHRDAPVSEPSDIAVFRLAELARKYVTVVLSGEGSDELFGGYPKHRMAPKIDWVGSVPMAVRGPLIDALERSMPPRLARARIALRTLRGSTEAHRVGNWFAPFTETERHELVGQFARHPHREYPTHGDFLRRMLAADLQAWLPDNLLERGDRMSMAASLELRPPFLDHRLVELAFSLPSSVKIRGGSTKWVVKEVARRYLPDAIVDRRKVGFRAPLDAWFRGGLEEMAWDLLSSSDSIATTLLDGNAVRRLLQRHRSGVANEEARIWPLLSLEVWHQTFFRGKVPVRVR